MESAPQVFDSDLLYNLATTCEELFDRPISAFSDQKDQLEEQWTECQQRFSIWASQMGVFARKGRSLDAKLRKLPDVQDIVARLLDVLRRSLSQFVRVQLASQSSGEEERLQPDAPQTALATIDETLTRLNRLGTDIRAASRGRVNLKIQEFTSRLDLLPLQDMAQAAVESLYPSAHDALKAHLCKGMVDICARIRYWEHRQGKLNARRPAVDIALHMETIEEDAPMSTPTADTTNSIMPTNSGPGVQTRRPSGGARNLPTQSDPSTINTQQMRRFLGRHLGVNTPTEKRKTSSVQIQQANYPRPHVEDSSNLFQCEWCSDLFNKKEFSESDWRRHVDKDLKPYRCMAENCHEAHPSFGSFVEWSSHMLSHSRRWYQRVFLTEGWACPVCDFDRVYNSPLELLPHLEGAHSDQFNTAQLQIISRQGVVVRPRGWNECPVCSFTVEETKEQKIPDHPKRQGGHLEGVSAKMARTTLETGTANRHGGNTTRAAEAASSDSEMDSSDSDDVTPTPTISQSPNATIMARHVAAHHQALMLLTIRFAALLNVEDDYDDHEGADSIDIYGSVDQSGTADVGRVSSFGSVSEAQESGSLHSVESIPDTTFDLRQLIDGDDDIEPDETPDSGRDPVQEEADRAYREIRVAQVNVAEPEPSVVGKWNEEEDPIIITVGPPGSEGDGGDPVVRIVTPPLMKRAQKKSKYDGPNADVRIDNVIMPRDLDRFKSPQFVGGTPVVPIFKSRDPSAERERPMLNLVLPTPRHTPPASVKGHTSPPKGSNEGENLPEVGDGDGDHDMEDAPEQGPVDHGEEERASTRAADERSLRDKKSKKISSWGSIVAAMAKRTHGSEGKQEGGSSES